MSNITGFYGCSCHPFDSWEACDKAHNQKFIVGELVKNRCTGEVGDIYQICEEKGFYIVKYGELERDKRLQHAAELMPKFVQLSLFDNDGSQEMDKGAAISGCGSYRYSLWRIWDKSKPLVLFICLNPSTADGHKDDPTLRRLIAYARQWEYGGLFLGNLFAFRTPHPCELRKLADPVGPENDIYLKQMALTVSCIIFGWGNDGYLNGRDKQVLSMFPTGMCFGVTKYGYPKHPLYLHKHSSLIPWTETRVL